MQPSKEQVEKFNKTYELSEEIHNSVNAYALDAADILNCDDLTVLNAEPSYTLDEYAYSEYVILKRNSGEHIKDINDVSDVLAFIATL